MRRTEDISFDYSKNTETVQNNTNKKKDSFVVSVKEKKKKEPEQKSERPVTVKVKKVRGKSFMNGWIPFCFQLSLFCLYSFSVSELLVLMVNQ